MTKNNFNTHNNIRHKIAKSTFIGATLVTTNDRHVSAHAERNVLGNKGKRLFIFLL